MKRPIIQAVILILGALVLALAANALAPRQRKLALVGWYPSATTVTTQRSEQRPSEQRAASSERVAVGTPAPVVTTVAPIPAPTPAPAPVSVPQPAKKAQVPTQPSNPATQQPKTDIARFAPHPEQPYIEIGYADVA